MVAHCLFEQSGTFKNAFKKNGIQAFDYDILNDFGETDFQIDLFKEIEGGYEHLPSIFDRISKDDVIIAFFPCTRFEGQVQLFFRGVSNGMDKWADKKKVEYALKMHDEQNDMYMRLCKLFVICYERELKLVVENPWNNGLNYLCKYFPVKAKIIDKNRRDNGDYYQKPTQFWFVNLEPKQTMLFEPLEECELLNIEHANRKNSQVIRSMIHQQYADRFIRQYIL